MTIDRREFITFLGLGLGSAFLSSCEFSLGEVNATKLSTVPFVPIKSPIPLTNDGVPVAKQPTYYSTYNIEDDLVLPKGYTYDVIAVWGDKVGDSRFGVNNDYLAFVPINEEEGYLVINFEYISAIPWRASIETILGRKLPFAAVEAAIAQVGGNGLDFFALPLESPLRTQVVEICQEALIDMGMGVISLKRTKGGKWERTFSDRDRRITGISGLKDGKYLNCTGPAKVIFQKTKGRGYIDGLADRIVGTFQNCAGGTTPWGTVLSAEENYQSMVIEPVFPDGTAFPPQLARLYIGEEGIAFPANALGYAGNKYGWMVEIDPADPKDYGTKHTWLGRFRHEAVAVRTQAGKPLAVYSGCDRRGGHIYKFVSREKVLDPKDKKNSRLFHDGTLYSAQFYPDGTGRWIPLRPNTPVSPTPLAFLSRPVLPLPLRPEGGVWLPSTDQEMKDFVRKFKTLGDLYEGSSTEKQGAILIDAHYAANAAGATCTARPEDTEIAPDGSLYITFTSGTPSSTDGSPDLRIFRGPNGSTSYEFGWIMRLVETENSPDALTFTWKMIATGGEPAEGGMGFANPDNLAFDWEGNLWFFTDISSGVLNQSVPKTRIKNNILVSPSNVRGIYGSNSIWCMPTKGSQAGQAFLFGYGPIDSEVTGPCFAPDRQTLFLSIQHPGEEGGTRQNMATETREFALLTTNGKEFLQKRTVPLGSNWPSKQKDAPPRSAIVAVRKIEESPETKTVPKNS